MALAELAVAHAAARVNEVERGPIVILECTAEKHRQLACASLRAPALDRRLCPERGKVLRQSALEQGEDSTAVFGRQDDRVPDGRSDENHHYL